MTGSSGFKEISTIPVAGTSKFYYEVVNTSAAGWQLVGVFVGQPDNPSNALSSTPIWGFASTQATYYGGSYTSTSDVPSWSNNDVMGIKYENGNLKLYKNGTLATATTSSVPTGSIVFAYIANDNTNAAAFVRFNSDSWTQDSAAGVDATWELSTANLPDPTIKLPNQHFNTLLYTGNDSSDRDITGVGFQPDWLWIKNREGPDWNQIIDAVRGANKTLFSNTTDGEDTDNTNGHVNSFLADGFNVTAGDSGNVNENNENYVAWNWNAGGSTVTNNDGSISSSVRANTTAGFSIIAFEGTGSLGTVGHGLGVKPDVMIFKNRDQAHGWLVYHSSLGATKNLSLNTNAAVATASNKFNDTEPTSTVFTVNTAADSNQSGQSIIAYCFSEVKNYSKFGSYTGNGNADGTFVYTGFRPAWIMTKNADTGSTWWFIYDVKRETYNPQRTILGANVNNAEYYDNAYKIDILSNGFKARGTQPEINKSGDTIIYLAFAESPFKYARAR